MSHQRRLRVLTAFDPHHADGDLLPTINDLYLEPGPYDAHVLLAPAASIPVPGVLSLGANAAGLELEDSTWIRALATTVLRQVGARPFGLLHFPQLSSLITQALVEAFPHRPCLVVRPGDLARAASDPGALAALQCGCYAMHALAVPSRTIAGMLLEFVPGLDPDRLIPVPFPVPEHLLATAPLYSRPHTTPRVLYIGSTGEDTGIRGLIHACKRAKAAVTLAIGAAPVRPPSPRRRRRAPGRAPGRASALEPAAAGVRPGR